MLRLWPASGHPWENSQEETRHSSRRRKAGLGLFHSSGPFWTQQLLAGIGPAGIMERLEMPAGPGENRPCGAGSSLGPQTPRDQEASREAPCCGWRDRASAQLRGQEQTFSRSWTTASSRVPASLQVGLREHPRSLQPVPGAEGPLSARISRKPPPMPSCPELQLPAGTLCALGVERRGSEVRKASPPAPLSAHLRYPREPRPQQPSTDCRVGPRKQWHPSFDQSPVADIEP